MTRTVLVTDGEQRAALAVVRSLGAAGYRCLAGANGRSLAGASRWAGGAVTLPDPGADPQAYARAVAAAVRTHEVDLVLPIAEPAILALLTRREELGAVIPFPALSTFRTVCDKAHVLRIAREVGIRVPGQQVLTPRAGAGDLELPLPVVLKPARSVYTAPDGTRGKVGVRWARNATELADALASYPEAAYPILAQEAISGPGVGHFVLLRDGRLLARFAHRRLREKPPSGGVSVLRRSEPMDEEFLGRGLALLERLEWDGVAMVEYKLDERTGEAVLMEINGRLWGSLQLAIDAGVDFPRLLVESALGGTVEPVLEYRHATSRWFWGDVDHLIAVMRAPLPGASRGRAVGRWLRDLGTTNIGEVFRWSDPRPFLHESRTWFSSLRHA